jgi:hypothetical protein
MPSSIIGGPEKTLPIEGPAVIGTLALPDNEEIDVEKVDRDV